MVDYAHAFYASFPFPDRYDLDGGLDGRALALAAKQNAKSLIIICQNLI